MADNHEIELKPLGFFKRTNPPVFLLSAAVMVVFILSSTFFTESARDFFGHLQFLITHYFSWVFTFVTTVILLAMIYLLFSPIGKLRLGGPDERPEFSRVTWFAMLFSAGMGIGLVFWSIAEPISHYMNPPSGPGETLEAARQAMRITFFHWGFHAWAVYCMMGLALAYFAFRLRLPLTIRSVFYPVLGNRIYGPWGHAIDIFAVVSTMFGVSTSLGLGAMQVNSGLNFITGWEESTFHQVLLIAGITAVATTSVVLGLVKGISRLSHFNLWLSAGFLLFVLAAGPTVFLFSNFFETIGDYLPQVFTLGIWSESFPDEDWRASWTTFYWAWWVAWSPFVGMFIARVSRGRTIREFVFWVLIAPCLATFVWLSVFGGTALHQEMYDGSAISQAVAANVSRALFITLQEIPFQFVSVLVAVVVIITYFVTSSDSGSLVIDIITAGGLQEPPKNQRIFWAITEGMIAIVLLVFGGLKALQTAAIASGFPFSFILLGMCFCLFKALRKEHVKSRAQPVEIREVS
jgi:choline/glycine/proline betaine transport protein